MNLLVRGITTMSCLLALAAASAEAQGGGPTVTISPASSTYTTTSVVSVTINYCSARPFDMATHSITVNGADATSGFTISGAIPPGCIYGMRATGSVSLAGKGGGAAQKTLEAMVENIDGYLGGASATYTYMPPGFVREAHAVWVTPLTYARQSWPSTWDSTDFVVSNEGTRAGTYNLTAQCVGAASSCSVLPTSVLLDTLAARRQTVRVRYFAGATQGDSARIKLTATNSAQATAWDTATTVLYVVKVSPPRPVGVEILGDTSVRNRSLCVTVAAGTDGAYECGDVRLAHGLPAVRTRNQLRQLTLLYNSAQARAYPTVSADVTLPSNMGAPQRVEARLWHNGVMLASGTWPGNQWGTGVTRRITLGFDANSMGTEVFAMQFEVAHLWSNNTWTYVSRPANVPIVNRATSPFGAGWWIAGLEQLVPRADGSYLRIGGDGSTALYKRVGSTNVWRAPGYSGPDSLFQDGTGSIRRRLPHGAQVVFNAQGRHISTEPLMGPATQYLYDASGRLTSVVLPSGTTSVRYDVVYTSSTAYYIDLNTGGNIRRSDFVLANGLMTRVTEPDSRQVQFAYGTGNDAARVTARTDRVGSVTSYTYDAARKLIRHSLTLGDNTVIATDFQPAESRGFPGTVNAAAQHPDSAYTLIDGPRSDVADVTRIWVNGHGAPTRTRDAHGWETQITYDATFAALPKEVLSPGGTVSKAWYNARGLVDSSAILNLRSPGDPAAVSRVTWHPSLALATLTRSPTGDVTNYGYNTNGTLQWAQPGTSTARRSTFSYLASGAAAGLYWNSTVPGTSAIDNVAYDAALGNVSAVTNRLQKTSTVAQDEFGRVRATVSEFASGKFRTDSTYYDLLGRDTLNVSRATAMSYTPQYVQTGTVNMPVMTLKVSQQYDAESNLTEVTRWSVPDPVAGNVMRNTYEYDRAGRRTSELRAGGGTDMPLPTGSQFFTYDPAGNLIQHQEGSVRRTMEYDALGRLKRRATQNQSYGITQCSALDPSGINGPCSYKFPLLTGGTTGITIERDTELFGYDRSGNMTRADNQHALINRTYSPGGLMLTDTLRIRKLLYATSGSVVPAQDFTQHVYGIGYGYDAAGRRASLKFPDQLDPCSGACPLQQYLYESGTGLLSRITDIRGQIFDFVYTNAGQLQQLTYPGTVNEQILQYDAEGSPLVRHVTRSGGAWIADTVTYDPLGRPTRVQGRNLSSSGSQVLSNAYTGLGALAMQEFDNGGTPRLEQYWTDALASQYEVRRHNIRLAQSERNPAIRYSRYVGDGKVARDSAQIPANNTYYDNTDYFYDLEGRTRHSYTRTNDYYAGINDYVQTASYYDGNGRLALFERHLGDMQQASLGNDPRAVVESYRYDALGRRVLTHALRAANCTAAGCESTVQRFVWDGDQLLYEVRARGDSGAYSNGGVEDDVLDGNGIYGALKAYGRVGYTHAGGIDRPIGAVRGTTPFYPHTNSRGLYENATIDNGTLLTNGVAWPGQSASAYLGWTPRSTPYEWFGSLVTEQADASGLLYRRNRYYDPTVGRFTQPDPIGIAGGLNSYGFANGDPVNFSDPFGLCPKDKGGDGKTRSNSDCPEGSAGWRQYRSGAIEAVDDPLFLAFGGLEVRGAKAVFASGKLLAQHFEKHGAEFGARTAGQFLRSAQKFFAGGGTETVLRGTDRLFYREATNEFGVLRVDGVIRTYFKPREGRAYFDRIVESLK